MAEWLLDEGVGETRAALIEDGRIVEARIDRDDGRLRAGAVVAARLGPSRPDGRAEARGPRDAPLLLPAAPAGLSEGAALRIVVTREALRERGRLKPAHARLAEPDEPERPTPPLADALTATGLPVVRVRPHGPDVLEEAGWSELVEEARTGDIGFPGGRLLMALTPAMTLFDVDGDLPAPVLAIAGARAAAAAIRRHGIAGSIGIDLPTLTGKADRQAAAAALDAALPQPFERTAVNGFGFLQIVRRRERASLPELIAAEPALAAALALLRRTSRTPGAGRRTLVASPPVTALIAARPDWLARVERETGTALALRADPALPIWSGYVEAEHP